MIEQRKKNIWRIETTCEVYSPWLNCFKIFRECIINWQRFWAIVQPRWEWRNDKTLFQWVSFQKTIFVIHIGCLDYPMEIHVSERPPISLKILKNISNANKLIIWVFLTFIQELVVLWFWPEPRKIIINKTVILIYQLWNDWPKMIKFSNFPSAIHENSCNFLLALILEIICRNRFTGFRVESFKTHFGSKDAFSCR